MFLHARPVLPRPMLAIGILARGRRRRWPLSLTLFAVVLLLPLPGPAGTAHHVDAPTAPRATRYVVGGTRWMPSSNHEIIHFICRPHHNYVIGLSSRGLGGRSGSDAETQRAYLHALEEAVRDWAERMECPTLRVEMDPPYPDVQVRFGTITGLHTLAVATRAGDITLRSDRGWFPGSERKSRYLGGGSRVSFYWVVAHELGHVFGIGHSDSPGSLMYPTQCPTCRWSSFEQAAANVIHATSLVPAWSRRLSRSRFFVRTPVSVVPSLLSGTLPDEALALLDPAAPENTCRARKAKPDDARGGFSPDPRLLKQPLSPPRDLEITASLHTTFWVRRARRRLAEGRHAALRCALPPSPLSRPANRRFPRKPDHAMIGTLVGLPSPHGEDDDHAHAPRGLL